MSDNKQPPNLTGRSRRTHKNTKLQQAIAMQKIAFELAQDPSTAPNTVSALMRAWCDVDERIRIIRMKPKPKDIDVSAAKATSARPAPPKVIPSLPKAA